MFIDCVFYWSDPFRGRDQCPAHKLVVAKSSRFWRAVFANDPRNQRTYGVPLDILDQFQELIELWYDPDRRTPSDPDEEAALWVLADVYGASGVQDRISRDPHVPRPMCETQMALIAMYQMMDNVSISGQLLIQYPNLEGAIADARQRAGERIADRIANFVPVDFFDFVEKIAPEFLSKIVKSAANAPNSQLLDSMVRFINDSALDISTISHGWQSLLTQTSRASCLEEAQNGNPDHKESSGNPPVPIPELPVPILLDPRPAAEIGEVPKTKRIRLNRRALALRNLARQAMAKHDEPAPAPAAVLQNASLFAYVLLTQGAAFAQQERIFALLNIVVPEKTHFYAAQREICAILVRFAELSCALWKEEMADQCGVSFDGSWSQRRGALHCFGAFIDPYQKRVVDFEVVEQDQKNFSGNYVGTAQAMEGEILRRLGARWKGRHNVKYFCHDRDNKAMKILRDELNWPLIEKLDRNHIIKTWRKRFEDDKKSRSEPGKKRRTNLLGSLEVHLLRWFYTVLNRDATLDEKEALWLGAFAHYADPEQTEKPDSFIWERRTNQEARHQLGEFLRHTVDLIKLVQTEVSTQLNESLHAMKARIAPKDKGWKCSWKARCAVAILNMNQGHEWVLLLHDALNFEPLSPECRAIIDRQGASARALSLRRSDSEFQRRVRMARIEKKQRTPQLVRRAKEAGVIMHE